MTTILDRFDALNDPLEVLRRHHVEACSDAALYTKLALGQACARNHDEWGTGYNAALYLGYRRAAKDALRRKIDLGAVLALHEARP
jgi:hypothetical protein